MFSTLPSDPKDPRFLRPASADCPNEIRPDEALALNRSDIGTCGHCAWGFYTPESSQHQLGESVANLGLMPAQGKDGAQAGYTSRCGKVRLFRDNHGRIGAMRRVGGEDRFFPGVEEKFAHERFVARNPELFSSQVSQ